MSKKNRKFMKNFLEDDNYCTPHGASKKVLALVGEYKELFDDYVKLTNHKDGKSDSCNKIESLMQEKFNETMNIITILATFLLFAQPADGVEIRLPMNLKLFK